MLKKIKVAFLLQLLAFTFVAPLVQFRPVQAEIDFENVRDLSLQHRKLVSSLRCLTGDVIDDDDEVTDLGDLFDDREYAGRDTSGGDMEISIWGFDRNENGLAQCISAIEHALQALGEDDSNLGIVRALTGGEDFDDGAISANTVRDNWPLFRRRVEEERNRIADIIRNDENGSYNTYLLKERVFPLIDLCFDIEERPYPRSIAGDSRNFEAPIQIGTPEQQNIGFFFKGDNDIRGEITTDNGGWIDDDGNGGRPTHFGDIKMPDLGETLDPATDGFYPLGTDTPPGDTFYGDTVSDEARGLIACDFIERFRIFWGTDVVFEDGTLTLIDPATGDAADITEPPLDRGGDDAGDEEPTCEENFDFAFSWLVCAAIGLLDSAIGAMINTIDNMLSVGPEEYNNADVQEAWSYFRNIASFLLVVIGLVMIIGQAVSKE